MAIMKPAAGIVPHDASHISPGSGQPRRCAMGRKRRVGILVFDGVTLLDVAGPSEVFAEANRFGADYEVMLYSADGQNVVSSTGMPASSRSAVVRRSGSPGSRIS